MGCSEGHISLKYQQYMTFTLPYLITYQQILSAIFTDCFSNSEGGLVIRRFSNGKDGIKSCFSNSVDGLTDWLSNSVEC